MHPYASIVVGAVHKLERPSIVDVSESFVDNAFDLPWQNFLSPGFGTKLAVPEFSYDTVWDMTKEAPVPKTSYVYPAISILYWLVMDRQTDTHRITAYTMLAWRRMVIKAFCLV